ncbi:MAG: hypothetical protein DMG72_17245 [Acidobacteria bacterium]|nr:MAG: hypothetical protein DMG72_17245 [Acidobacteriota bacterium]
MKHDFLFGLAGIVGNRRVERAATYEVGLLLGVAFADDKSDRQRLEDKSRISHASDTENH